MDGLGLGTALLSLVGVLLGASLQRLSGMGFALVASPLLVVSLGPHLGVRVANLLSALLSGLILLQTWRAVEYRRLAWLLLPALLAIPLGNLALQALPVGWLLVGIGSALALSLGLLHLCPSLPWLNGRKGAVIAGACSGFMNITAGIGGPMIALYAASTRWPQAAFVGSVQAYFLITNLSSLLTKGGPPLMPHFVPLAMATLGCGLFAGVKLSQRVPVPVARRITLGLAWAGAIGALVKGVLLLEGQ